MDEEKDKNSDEKKEDDEESSEEEHKKELKTPRKENKKEEKSHHHKKQNKILKDLSKNYWAISTVVLVIAVIVLLIFLFRLSPQSGGAVSSEEAGQIMLDFASAQNLSAELVSVEEESGLYKVTLTIQGQEMPVYLTKDGENLISSIYSVEAIMSQIEAQQDSSEQQTPEVTEPEKSDKPVVELFVMSYCPYGTMGEKGIIPVVELLGDKINFRIRYVYYAMHGEPEVTENLREYCVQEVANDKFLDYMRCFLEGDGVESGGYIKNGNDPDYCLEQAGIDKTAIETCMSEADEEFAVYEILNDESKWLNGRYPLFNVDATLNTEYGIGGSPTLVINGVQVSSARDPASYLQAICDTFIDAPEECSESLSTTTPGPYFGWDGEGSATNAQC